MSSIPFPYLETCGVRKWGKEKEKEGAGYEASTVPVLWHEMSLKNTSPKHIDRQNIRSRHSH